MPYSSDIARILTDQLAKFVTLNRHQLAGQVANLDFWLDEVRHAIHVIDDYGPRFEPSRTLSSSTPRSTGLRNSISETRATRNSQPHRRGGFCTPTSTRRDVPSATDAYRFLVRCFNEGFITESVLREACGSLEIGIEARDLRSRI